MQTPLTPSTIGGGFNGSQAFPNWNWSMQAFQPPFIPTQATGAYGEFNYATTNMSTTNNSGSTPEIMEGAGITLNRANSLGTDHNNIEMNNQDAMKLEQEMFMNANVASMAFNTSQQQHIYQQPTNFSQRHATEQQAMVNRVRYLNPLMFQNTNTDNVIATDSKMSDTLAASVLSETNKFNDANTLNQYNFKKERLSPIPPWFPGLCQPISCYPDSNNINSSITSESIAEPNSTGMDNLANTTQQIVNNSTFPSVDNSNIQSSITPTTPQPTAQYYANPLSNPMSNFWGSNLMYNSPTPFSQFFNPLPQFSGNSNSINPAQMIGPAFRFPNGQFNPFVPSAEMAAATFHSNYFPSSLQQQSLLQQQPNEQFLALANQQHLPVIKQENEPTFTATTPISEEDKKLEDEHLPSSHTDEEGDRLVKPRKSSKCQCPNCTNPQPEDENAKIIKKHACHWPGCPKTYGKTSHLKSHIRQHQGIRPFICPDQTCLKVCYITIVQQFYSKSF